MSRAKSSLAVALQVHGEEVERVEQLYLEQAGEVTEEVERAEQARDLAAGDALEHLARYRAHITDQQRAIVAEYERLAKLAAEYDKRASWVDDRMAGLVRAQDPTAKSRRAGLHTVKVRDYYSVQALPDLDLDKVPPHWLRDVPAVPAQPATVALAKVEAKKDLRAGWRTGEPTGPGWYEVDQRHRLSLDPTAAQILLLFLWRGRISEAWRYSWGLTDGHPARFSGGHRCRGQDLASIGYSITPEAGLDQLRWRHHAPGVELRCRVGVSVV